MVQIVLQSAIAFCYYKVGKLLLQSGTSCFITKSEYRIIKWSRYYKVDWFYHKVGWVLQSGS